MKQLINRLVIRFRHFDQLNLVDKISLAFIDSDLKIQSFLR